DARMRRWVVALGVAAMGALTGCRGWGRVQTGGAYDLGDRAGHSGNVIAADAAFGLKNVKWFNTDRPFPFAIHTSADVILAPDRKSYGWGTGLVLYREPRPVSAYALAGTSLHFDDIGGKFSFGNVSPYGEVGVMTSVPSRYDDGGDGLILTLGIAGASYINYLVANETIDGFILVKLGIGWEKN
ncbi:MAG TPA: hypothetical protein VIF62_26150, partial [Labilithrix sp.]